MKIFCVGKNYINHVKEMKSVVPKVPVIFMKPSTAFLDNRSSFYYPEFSNEIQYEVELVIKIAKQGKNIAQKFVADFIESITLGIDFTARDIQRQCKEKGLPWELAKSFDFSAAVGDFVPVDYHELNQLSFNLDLNGVTVQDSNTSQMIFDAGTLIQFISKRFTFQKGDLLFTGTPEGVGKIHPGDMLEGFLEKQKLLEIDIR